MLVKHAVSIQEKIQQTFEIEIKFKGVYRNMKGYTFEVNLEKNGWFKGTIFLYHFADPGLGVEILFEKEVVTEKVEIGN